MPDFHIRKYDNSLKTLWDNFVDNSKNGTFLFKRDYMEYHADRFPDCSLIFFRNNEIYALLPASRSGNTFSSHGGLTYGGLVMNQKCVTEEILLIFNLLIIYLKENKFLNLIYKPVPYIYDLMPSEEDLYALFRNNAVLKCRNVASVISQSERIKFRQIRKSGIKKALGANIIISESDNYKPFWNILENNLFQKYGARPVHSLEEIEKLSFIFPDNIKLFIASKDKEILGGVVCYISSRVIHVQYISASALGKEMGAIDLIFNFLIDEKFRHIPYFDLGTSNGDDGRYLNTSLIYQKEGFGGRAVCYDTYEISIA